MNWLNTLFQKIYELFNWFYTVVPWERAMRVRMGKHMRVMLPGIHIQIPFIDKVFLMNIRDRAASTCPQTLTTVDGVTITLQVAYRFEVTDIEPMYNRLHQAANTISQEIEGRVSEFVTENRAEDVSPGAIRENVLDKIDLSKYGLKCTKVFLTDFARVKTYRLINGGMERYQGVELNTNSERKGNHNETAY